MVPTKITFDWVGFAYLLTKQNDEGFFATRDSLSRQQMYAQAIATITFCEAFGMTGDSKYRIAAQKAIDFAEWSQSDLKGWRYNPREGADLIGVGWFLMALVMARWTNLTVNEEVFQKCQHLFG